MAGWPDGRTVSALYGTPGLKLFTTIGTSAVRGAYTYGGDLFAVSSNTLYRVDVAGIATSIGTLATANGRVAFANNGNVLMLVDGSGGYLWDGTALSAITDPDFPAATQVVFSGGYFIFDNPAIPGQFMVSTLYATDPANMVDALDFATAESDPDGLISLAVSGGSVWLLGESTTEPWYHSGEVFPFNPVGGAKAERGCVARWSVAKAGESLLWLASDRVGRIQVVMAQGGAVNAVSTPALEHALAGYPSLSDASAYAYHQEGHLFYVLSFPSAGATWVYDLTTAMWHRRGGWIAPNWTRHRGDTYAYFAGKHLVGDHQTGSVYEIDPNSHTDNGQIIRRERTAPVVHGDGAPLFFAALEIHMETGVGDLATPAPILALDWSDDGGHTWSADAFGALDGGAGATGEYGKRVVFRRLGQSRRRNFRLVVSDPVKVAILGADLSATEGK